MACETLEKAGVDLHYFEPGVTPSGDTVRDIASTRDLLLTER
jgi:hypothetical protein